MKKLFLTCTLFLAMQAQALVGLFGGGATVALAGLATSGSGFVVTVLSGDSFTTPDACYTICTIGTYLTGIGFIVLDEESGKMTFKELVPEDKDKFGLTQEQFDAFNYERDEINSLIEEVAGRVNQNAEVEQAVKEARTNWEELKGNISEDAFRVAQIIVDHVE